METTTQRLSKNQKEEITQAAKLIFDSFGWDSTKSKNKYWDRVHNKLMELRNQKECTCDCHKKED